VGAPRTILSWFSTPRRRSGPVGVCGACRHFRNDARYLEAAIPGLSSLGSATGSARADDGLCLLRDLYLGSRSSCGQFSPMGAGKGAR
jgi:hypothetical protein